MNQRFVYVIIFLLSILAIIPRKMTFNIVNNQKINSKDNN